MHEERVEESSARHAVSAQVYRRSREENLIILNLRRLHFVIEESRHFQEFLGADLKYEGDATPLSGEINGPRGAEAVNEGDSTS